MATYPDLPTKYSPAPKPIKSLAIDRAEDGTARVRSMMTADKLEFGIKHPYITAAEWATLNAFYLANRNLVFDYVSKHDSVTYSCVFAAAPRTQLQPGNRYDVDVEMEQV